MLSRIRLALLVALVAGVALLPFPSLAQGPVKVFRCPERLEGISQSLATTPEGWESGRLEVTHWVANLTFYDGPVAEKASLVPDASGRDGEKVNESWKLNPKNPRDYWIECSYLGTSLTLMKNIGRGYRQCTAQYDPNVLVGGQPSFEELRCR